MIQNPIQTHQIKILSKNQQPISYNKFNYDELNYQLQNISKKMASNNKNDQEHINQKKRPYIGQSHQAPQFMKKNIHITSGYRLYFEKPIHILKSLFMIHNQTVNIWTHLIAAIIIFGTIIKLSIQIRSFKLQSQGLIQQQEHLSQWPILVFLFSALTCLMCSVLFHLFYPMSKRTYRMFSRFDYAGISVLIAGSGFPLFYYSMYCQFNQAVFYLSLSMIAGIIVFILSLFEWFHQHNQIKIRGIIYSIYGLLYILPVSHILIDINFYNKNGDTFQFMTSLPYIILLATSYLGGCSIYVKKCPERKYPGQFNLCGNSHQIWHGFVILGIVFTYIAAINSFQMRKVSICPKN